MVEDVHGEQAVRHMVEAPPRSRRKEEQPGDGGLEGAKRERHHEVQKGRV